MRDFSDELSLFSANVPVQTSVNIDQIITDSLALSAALEGVSLGVQATRKLTNNFAADDGALPAESESQREMAWLVTYRDTVEDRRYTVSIPCPDVTNEDLFVQGTGLAFLGDPLWTAFITAFEALIISQDGNAVSVESARFTGRNL